MLFVITVILVQRCLGFLDWVRCLWWTLSCLWGKYSLEWLLSSSFMCLLWTQQGSFSLLVGGFWNSVLSGGLCWGGCFLWTEGDCSKPSLWLCNHSESIKRWLVADPARAAWKWAVSWGIELCCSWILQLSESPQCPPGLSAVTSRCKQTFVSIIEMLWGSWQCSVGCCPSFARSCFLAVKFYPQWLPGSVELCSKER